MPTLKQMREVLDTKIRKFGEDAHCNVLVVSEEARGEAIENKPDEHGRRRTRIALETYSPEAYIAWNQLLENSMEKCGYNPILLVDVLATLVYLAGDEGFQIAHDQLCSQQDYETKLREAKQQRRKRREQTDPARTHPESATR